jgi:hypothetical protein
VVLRSAKRSSASGSCRAILRSKGRPLCAQKLSGSVRAPQRRTRALHARLKLWGLRSEAADVSFAGHELSFTARSAADA